MKKIISVRGSLIVAILTACLVMANRVNAFTAESVLPNAQPAYAYLRSNAYWHGIIYYASGLPEYGAAFNGSDLGDPNYTGSGGNGATAPFDSGIKNWGKWGWYHNYLQTPKRWIGYPWPTYEKTRPYNYNGLTWR